MIECLTYLTQFLLAYVAWVILYFLNMKREVMREKSESECCGLKVTRYTGKLRKKSERCDLEKSESAVLRKKNRCGLCGCRSLLIAGSSFLDNWKPNFGVLLLQIKGQFGMFYFPNCNPVFLCCFFPNETLLSYVCSTIETLFFTHGWMDIRRDYHISGDRHVQFCYTRNSCFEITVFPGTCTELSMQRYLHHAATEFHDTIFCVRLTKYQSRGSHLVYVKFFIFIKHMLTSH